MTSEAEIRKVFTAASEALAAGRITKVEHDYILTHYYGTTDLEKAVAHHADAKHEAVIAVVVAAFLIVALGFLFYNSSPTGLAVLDIPQGATSHDIMQNVSSIIVSGTLTGDGNASIYFDTAQGSLLVAQITSDPGLPQTERPSYAEGETINVIHMPENATYYFDDGATSVPVDVPFNASVNGTLLIVTASDTYRLPIIIGDVQRTTEFSDLCIETCSMDAANGTLRIDASEGTQVTISRLEAGTGNTAPAQHTALPSLNITEATALDLNQYFADPDGDTLHYSTSESPLVTSAVDGGILTLTPVSAGTETFTIYASDLVELVPATMEITVSVQEMPVSNETGNETDVTPEIILNETNITTNFTDLNATNLTNATLNATNGTMNATFGCDDPDPNKRPLECIQNENSTYFRPEEIMIESKDGVIVGKLTPIGNMLIKGRIIEYSTAEPGSRDWARGYEDSDGDFIATVWIDSATGDLHLAGKLTEANANIVYEPGLAALMNDREIILALLNTRTGDLTVRGNVIPYRRSFE